VKHIQQLFDVTISRQLAHLIVKRLGFSYKRTRKRGVSARKEAATPLFLSAFSEAITAGTVVAIDESGFDQRPAPAYGYAPKGVPAIVKWRPSSDRSRHNLVMAIHSSGAVHRTIQDKPVNGPTFANFIAGLPFARGAVLLLDNASIHKTSAVKLAMAGKGYVPLFLPPYSPEYNPIELVFGVIKNAFYRQRYSTSTFDLKGTVEACVSTKATPSTIRGCFEHVAKLVSSGFTGFGVQVLV
jgi:transposase